MDSMLKRSLETGVAMVGLTQKRAEAMVKDLVKAGEVRQERAQKAVDDLLARSRRNTNEMVKVIRREVQDQLRAVGLATRADVERLEAKISSLTKPTGGGTGASSAAKTSSTTRKAPASKSAAKKG